MDIPIVAGTISTVVFAVSNLPMLRKALKTRDVSSYSLSSIVMINAANVVYSLYVFTLPIGPIWGLHTFYVVSCAIMLVLCTRARWARSRVTSTHGLHENQVGSAATSRGEPATVTSPLATASDHRR